MVRIHWGGGLFEVRQRVVNPETSGPVCWDWDELWACPVVDPEIPGDLLEKIDHSPDMDPDAMWYDLLDQALDPIERKPIPSVL